MLIGIPIAISLAMVGAIGLFAFHGDASLVGLIPLRTLDSFVLTAVPLYIFMGEILVKCGASELIYRGASRLLAWLPGGLLHANIAACAMFAAISGSSPATAATIGTVAIPALKVRKYEQTLTLGSLAAGGTLGILIPPSINMIVYGVVADASIGRLFAGGVVPGLVLTGLFMIYVAIRVRFNPSLVPKEARFNLKSAGMSLLTDLEEIREAAVVEGASEWQLYTRVILPLLAPITLSAMIILGHISLKIFDLVFAMARPDNANTDVPALLMYITTFRGNQFAKGAAIGVILLVLVVVIVVPYLRSQLKEGAHE